MKDLFSTTAGILYFNDLQLDFTVFLGLGVSFIGAFLFSYLKVKEIYEEKDNAYKKNDDCILNENPGFIVYIIEPKIKV